VAYAGKMSCVSAAGFADLCIGKGPTLNLRLFRLKAWLILARVFFCSAVVRIPPAVTLRISHASLRGDTTHSSESMKLSRPVRMVATDHAAFHLA